MTSTLSSQFDSLPELLGSQHLVELGLYSSVGAVYQARLKGYSPSYIKMRHKVLYSKKAVLEFLESRLHPGDPCNGVTTPTDPTAKEAAQ